MDKKIFLALNGVKNELCIYFNLRMRNAIIIIFEFVVIFGVIRALVSLNLICNKCVGFWLRKREKNIAGKIVFWIFNLWAFGQGGRNIAGKI